jgi:hypothetical protein
MSHANHPPRTGFLRTLVIGTLFGAFVGIAELWIGIFGSWAEGREGVVLLSCTASGATLGLVATCLNWLTGRVALLKSDFTFALVAVIAGASAGLVYGLILGQKEDSWKAAIAGAVLVPLLGFAQGLGTDDADPEA